MRVCEARGCHMPAVGREPRPDVRVHETVLVCRDHRAELRGEPAMLLAPSSPPPPPTRPTGAVRTDWSEWGPCDRAGCRARSGEPCRGPDGRRVWPHQFRSRAGHGTLGSRG